MKYQHYKGGICEFVAEALHSETQELLVVYRDLKDGRLWVRPHKMFFENVEVDGKEVPRFKRLEE